MIWERTLQKSTARLGWRPVQNVEWRELSVPKLKFSPGWNRSGAGAHRQAGRSGTARSSPDSSGKAGTLACVCSSPNPAPWADAIRSGSCPGTRIWICERLYIALLNRTANLGGLMVTRTIEGSILQAAARHSGWVVVHIQSTPPCNEQLRYVPAPPRASL